MGLFQDKLRGMVPCIVRSYHKPERGPRARTMVRAEGDSDTFYDPPYMTPVREVCDVCDSFAGVRFLIVTSEESVGLKAAMGVLNYPLFQNWEDICAVIEEQGYSTKDLADKSKKGELLQLQVITRTEYIPLMEDGSSQMVAYYFTDLSEESFNDNKLMSIMSCEAPIQFVHIQEEQLDEPWVRELMMSMECEIIQLPPTDNAYYEEVAWMLLEDERYVLEEGLTVPKLVRSIRKKRGSLFSEEDIAWILDQAVKKARIRGENRILSRADCSYGSVGEELAPLEQLEQMVGLKHMKQVAKEQKALCIEQTKNPNLKDICRHMIYKGKPGTGKTMSGMLMAKILSEHGHSNGVFISASRKDIIGEYVGQTAPKVAELFNKARSGILFIDEAGFLLNESRGSFNQEAVKEFVRYMEQYRDVTVIFALYPHEEEGFLALDAGLRSRISKVIEFEDYSEEELLAITKGMCQKQGYELADDSEEIVRGFVTRQKDALKDEFGNAREVRKLVESAIIGHSIRCMEQEREVKKGAVLTAEDFDYGVKRICTEITEKRRRQIGF